MMERFISVAIMLMVGVASVFGQAAGIDPAQALSLGQDAQIRGFRVPNYNEEGQMTSQIFGDFARVLPDGNIEITELRMEFYSYKDDEKITDMTVTSPHCFFNRNKGMAVSDSDVRISRPDFVVTGKGFTFSNEKQELRILSESKVVVMAGRKSPTLKDLISHE